MWWLLSIIIFIIFWAFKWRKVKPNDTTNFIEIGKYQLNKTTMELVFKAQKVTLSAKETDLLYLLYTNCNTTLEKGYILEAVWGDSGDYVGRTLDVYISKLRKNSIRYAYQNHKCKRCRLPLGNGLSFPKINYFRGEDIINLLCKIVLPFRFIFGFMVLSTNSNLIEKTSSLLLLWSFMVVLEPY